MDHIHVLCINDKDYPSEIPVSKRAVKGQEYTITKIDKLLGMGGIMGVQLAEIDLSDCAPFLYFAASRFAPIVYPEPVEIEELESIPA